MQFKRFVVLVAACLALGVLVFLLRATRGADLDLAQHNTRLAQLRELSRLDAELDTAVSRARLRLDGEAVELAAAERAMLDAGKQLARGGGGLAGFSPGVDQAFGDYAGAMRSKLAALRVFSTRQAEFVKAYAEFRRLSERALGEALPSQQVRLRQQVAALVSGLTTYSIQTAPANGAEIAAQIGAVQAASSAAATPQAAALLKELAAAATAAQAANDGMRNATRPLLEQAGASTALQALAATYVDEYQSRLAAPDRYRLILVVYAGALLVAFGLLGLRLRRSFGELDRANAELQNTNANLETEVSARTLDLRKALDDLRLQQAQLIQSEKMASLGQMVAGVAHEINTPLGYARSNVGIVRESLEASRGQGASDEIFEECEVLLTDAEHGLQQIAELVMGLKNFSRVDRSQQEWFNVNEGIDAALKICRSELRGRITVEQDYGELPAIACAPSQLNQVFLNIINNAAQAIDGDGVIRITTRAAGDGVRIVIQDSGCGMDEQTKAHIFEPFFTTKDVGKGTGLGLSIVFRIIEDHHGRIEVESAPGQGTRFIITLPLGRDRRAVPQAAEQDVPNEAVFA